MDLFAPTATVEHMHHNFRLIQRARKNLASRQMMQSVFDRLPNPDNNLVLDFQTTGFDARIWELYLAAIFQNLGLDVSRPHERPDFLVSRGAFQFWVEATTANPTQGSELKVADGYWPEQDRIGLKLGSALYSKLQKRYWELPHVSGLPLVIALADFHDPHPVRNTSAPLGRYLYGMHVTLLSDPIEEGYAYEVRQLHDLAFGTKKVPAGYFFQPSAENISAVAFSNAGTIAKFTRMGLQVGLDQETVALRYGFAYGTAGDNIVPEAFYYLVGERQELWEEELHVYHNPNAKHPLPDDCFGKAIDIRFDEGDYYHILKAFHPLSSITYPIYSRDAQRDKVKATLRRGGMQFLENVRAREQHTIETIRGLYKK
jgi:hypothetical protein